METTYKQYLITNHEICIIGTKVFSLSEEICLFVGEELGVKNGFTKGGTPYWLLGEAYCTDRFPCDVLEDLNNDIEGVVHSITNHWTGRWVLILGKELITDACGLMSVFYHVDESGWMVSSSLALLSEQLGLSENKRVSNSGLTWNLLPSTIHSQVRLLFCTQKITLKQRLEIGFYNRFTEWKDLTHEQRVSTIISNLVIGLKNIEKYSERKIWLALTAGKDSRLTFAAALSGGVSFETYTARHRNMSDADRHIPIELAETYDISHHFLHKGRFSESKYKEYCAFSGFNSLGADAEFYATGQIDQIPNDAVVIKSGLFEAGQTYARSIAGPDKESFVRGIKSYYRDSFKDPVQETAFNEWLDYQDKHPMHGIDIRDRFYLEQRLNGWASAIEQSLSINSFPSVQIANSATVLGCLLYASADDRKDLRLSYDLIKSLNSELLDYPVNQRTFGDCVRIVFNGLKRRLHL